MTPQGRTATLSELVAEEIRALMGRRRMTQAQLAREIGKTEMWVSLRLRGKQVLDLSDMHLIAGALNVGVHELLPPPDVASRAAAPSATVTNLPLPEPVAVHNPRPRDNRPSSHPVSPRPLAGVRSSYVSRSAKRKRD